MMRHMTEGPGQQQPPQEPRTQASDGRREVLEGRVIPSRPSDPRHSFQASPQAQNPPRQPGPDAGGPQAQPWSQNHQQPAGQAQPGQGGQQGYPARPGAPGGPQGLPGQQQAAARPAQTPPQNPQGPQGPQNPPPSGAGPRPGPAAPAAGTPDWNALAAEQESGARKRRIMMLVGGIVAVAVIAGGVATAVVVSGKHGSDKPIAGPSASGGTSARTSQPQPSFSSVAPPPPEDPLDFISTAAKDTAPITVATILPGKQFTMNGRTYVKTNTATTSSCASAARAGLAGALAANGCTKLIRATYVNGKTAVTVGVAVFPDKDHAAKLQKVAQYIAPLNGGGVGDFCHAVACQMTSNAVGRYAYFAIAGYKNGKTLAPTDTVARQAANEASNFAFTRIIQRGRDAAQADANSK